MKRREYLNKIMICVLVVSTLVGCVGCEVNEKNGKSINNCYVNKENNENVGNDKKLNEIDLDNIKISLDDVKNYENYYAIRIINTREAGGLSNLEWYDRFNFDIVQVCDMEDEKVQQKIRNTIQKAMTGWIERAYGKSKPVSTDLTITYNSNRYLSFYNRMKFTYSNSIGWFLDCVTIDMKTGEQVLLDDLIELNEDFAEYIKYNQNKLIIPKHMWEIIPEVLDEESPQEIFERFKECTFTSDEFLDYVDYTDYRDRLPYKAKLGDLIWRANFFLKDGRLVIVVPYGVLPCANGIIDISVDDIEPFLKVEKW